MQHSLDCFLLKPDLPDEAGYKYVQAWLEYKEGKLMYRGKKVTDPDSSVAARKFYRKMWEKFLKGTDFDLPPEPGDSSKKSDRCVLQGDWMCSVATTFRKGLILFINDEKHEELKKLFPKGSKDGVGGLNTYVPILLCDIACPNSKKQFQEYWDDPVLQNFIRSAYTFANLIIVPDGFNAARSLPTEDYWDKTLENYFKNQESLQCETKKEDCKTLFRDLVKASRANGSDSLFLDEWLDKDNNPIPLLDKELNKPYKPDDWRKLMEEMTKRIDKRRKQMEKWIDEHMKQ